MNIAKLCIIGLCVLVVSSRGSSQDKQSDVDPIHPDEEIQVAIRDLSAALAHPVRTERTERVRGAIDRLTRLANSDQAAMVQQLIYHGKSATDVRDGMILYQVIGHAGISKTAMAQAIIDYLGTDDTALRKQVLDVADIIEDPRLNSPPDYSSYVQFLRGNDTPNLGLAKHLFDRAPGTALLTFMRVYAEPDEGKPIRWAEHVVADTLWKQRYGFLEEGEVEPEAVEQLDFLSRHEAWWARLYVAEILRQHAEFRTPELLARLRDDDHPLVRKTIGAAN